MARCQTDSGAAGKSIQLRTPRGSGNSELVGICHESEDTASGKDQRLCPFLLHRAILKGEPHLLAEDELTPEELKRSREIEAQLLDLSPAQDRETRGIFQFDEGPIVVICPDAPDEVRGSLANEDDPNFTKLQQYGDLDALLMLYGHLRAETPSLDVLHRLASEVVPDDYSTHVILLGGVGWNEWTRRMQRALRQVPVKQIAVKDLKAGDVFRIESDDGRRFFYPEYEEFGEDRELGVDVACIARLTNPFKANRTVTICNGIHSRGVLGAVRCLTDPMVRRVNEKYLSMRFPSGEFAILLRVGVVKMRLSHQISRILQRCCTHGIQIMEER